MGVSLSKGGNVSLSKEAPGLTAVLVGLGWDVRTTTGTDYDLDASALLLDASGKVPRRWPAAPATGSPRRTPASAC
ncbi:hypothetical protein SALBM217S_06688 [Streptomyces griseoloalbus]